MKLFFLRSSLCRAFFGVFLAACFEPEAPVNTLAGPKIGERRFRIEHERCDASIGTEQSVDMNGDGSSDLLEVQKDGVMVCRSSDLNRDSRPDVFEYFEGTALRRRETNLIDASFVTVAETFTGGALTLVEYDTEGKRRIDTWDHFNAAGKIDSRERDTNGDGKIDEWWTYAADGEYSVRIDTNADGEPDEVRRPDRGAR